LWLSTIKDREVFFLEVCYWVAVFVGHNNIEIHNTGGDMYGLDFVVILRRRIVDQKKGRSYKQNKSAKKRVLIVEETHGNALRK
jgi:hypothetical protein